MNEKKELFVRNLSYSTDEDGLRDFFSKFGEVIKVKILMRDGRSKGTGFVEFAEHRVPQKLLDDNEDLELDGRKLGINWSGEQGGDRGDRGDRRERRDNNSNAERNKTIFVGNLSYNSTEDEITRFFEDCGKVVNVRLGKDDSGKSKGYCHIDFENEEDVENALRKSGEELDGRRIRVDRTNGRGSGGNDRRGGRDFGGRRGGRGDRGRGGRGGFRGRGRGRDH